MSELNAEAVLASIVELRESIVESRKETAELRASIAEQGKRMEQETAELRASIAESTAELRASIAEQGKRMEQETAELRASIAESTAELRASIAEQGKRMEQETAELRASIAESTAEQGKRFDKVLDELRVNNHRVGDLSNKVGRIVEKIVLPGIVDKFNERGFKFDTVSANVEFLNEKKNGKLAELDALLENGKFVIAVETKTELTIKDVNIYIKRLQALRKISRFKGKKIYGAFSTAIAEQKSINYALEKGFYVLQQPDVMAVRIIDFPKGHSAKAW